MVIKNKIQSEEIINKLGLNGIEQIIIIENEWSKIDKYIKETGYTHYSVRSLKADGKFHHNLSIYELYKLIWSMKSGTKVQIVQSLKKQDESDLLLQGYVCVFDNYDIIAELNDKPGFAMRQVMNVSEQELKMKYYFNDVENKAPRCLVNSGIIDLIYEKGLFNCVVEFTYYNTPVGRNKEQLLIWEVRSY